MQQIFTELQQYVVHSDTRIVLLVWCVLVSYWVYRIRTKFKTDRSVVAQYEPYAGLFPMYTGILYDGRLDSRDISAGIIYLAEHGYIKIRYTNKEVLAGFNSNDYEFELLRIPDQTADGAAKEIQTLLFPADYRVGARRLLSMVQNDWRNNERTYQLIYNVFIGQLQREGYISEVSFRLVWPAAKFLLVLLLVCTILSFQLGMLLAVITFAIVVRAYNNRRTKTGYKAYAYLKGFRLFLDVTQADRYKFFTPIEKTPEVFVKYLPYAIALGVEEAWANEFVGVAMPCPVWYETKESMVMSVTSLASELRLINEILSRSESQKKTTISGDSSSNNII